MIRKVVKKARLSEHDEIAEDLAYWLSRPPEERVAAVEFLRRQRHGDPGRLQPVARVIRRRDPSTDDSRQREIGTGQ